MSKRSHWLIVCLVACALCTAPLAWGQAPDRTAPPKAGPPPSLRLPPIHKRALTSGLPVWVVETHEVPVVQVNLILKTGSAADPAEKFGVASLTADLLDEGAGNRTALEIADAVDYLGADLSTTSSFDFSVVRLHVPVTRLNDALPVMVDVVARPTFPQKELDRIRQERLTALMQARDDPASIVRSAFPRIIFGARHRYGTPAIGTAAALKALASDDLRSFHANYYRPTNAALVVVGDVNAAGIVQQLETHFGSWKGAGAIKPASPLPTAPQLDARRVYLIDKPGAAQSQVRIGWIGVPRSTPDFFPLQVLNTILGGSFTSRLNQNLREDHGYSYGAGSAFDMRAATGLFFASAGVQTDKTVEALKEFFKELNGILKPIPADELAKAKNYVALRYPGAFETTRSFADLLGEMIVDNLPEDYFNTYVARIQAVTAADVQRVAAKYLDPSKFAVVIVGDRKVVEAGIRELNLGPLSIVALDEVMN